MDRDELIERLDSFIDLCNKRGYTIEAYELEPAYSGDDSTSYKLKIYAPEMVGLEGLDEYETLQAFTSKLWEATDEKTREKIFGLFLVDDPTKLIEPIKTPEVIYERSTVVG